MGGAKTDALALADMSSATTDGAGKFVVSGLPEGQYKRWAPRGRADVCSPVWRSSTSACPNPRATQASSASFRKTMNEQQRHQRRRGIDP
jgi:hypothetical protein